MCKLLIMNILDIQPQIPPCARVRNGIDPTTHYLV